jgi:hypothetical protein
MKKLNAKGFAHWVIPALVIVVVGGIGSYLLTQSHADSIQPYIVATNSGSGAQAPITVSAAKGFGKTGTDVNTLKAVGGKTSWAWLFCGQPNASYSGNNLYKVYFKSVTSQYGEIYKTEASGLPASKSYATKPEGTSSNCTFFARSNTPSKFFTGTKVFDLCNSFSMVYLKNEPARNGPYFWGVKNCSLNDTTVTFKYYY